MKCDHCGKQFTTPPHPIVPARVAAQQQLADAPAEAIPPALKSWPDALYGCSPVCEASLRHVAALARQRSYWRVRAAPIVQRVLREHDGDEERVLRLALRAAYPFEESTKKKHPYRVWRDEIARQRGLKPRLGVRASRSRAHERQLPLFAGPAP